MLAASQSNPAAQNLGQIDGFLLLGGGVPIRVGNIVIGAIGVGGAPGGPLAVSVSGKWRNRDGLTFIVDTLPKGLSFPEKVKG